jgi:hypothetical protein
MKSEVEPTINRHWQRGSFPVETIPVFRELKLAGRPYHGFGSAGNSSSARRRAGDGTGPHRSVEGHNDLSTQILNNTEISKKLMGELVPIIYKALKATP